MIRFAVFSRDQLLKFGIFLAVVVAMAAYIFASWPLREQSATPLPDGSSPVGGVTQPAAPGENAQPGTAVVPQPAAPTVKPAAGGYSLASFRMERDSSRAQQLELYREAMVSKDAATAQNAGTAFVKLNQLAGLEKDIENLIRASGFADAAVSVSQSNHVSVFVKAPQLTEQQARVILDIVQRTSGVKNDIVIKNVAQ